MNTALNLTSFEIIDLTGRSEAREIADDVHGKNGELPTAMLRAGAEHAHAVGLDADAVLELMNRDQWNGVLDGMPSTHHSGQYRKFVIEDILRMFKSPRFKALLREHKDAAAVAAKRAARTARERQQLSERIAREIEAEKAACPHLWSLVLELQAEVAALRR
jgi:hypothetical protein